MTKTINKKIQKLFESSEMNNNLSQHYIDGLLISWKEAEQKFHRIFISLWIFWGVTFLVAKGLVIESSLMGLKVKQIQSLLISSPIMIGLAGYVSLSTLGLVAYLRAAISESYKSFAPKLQEENLHFLLSPLTFLNIEACVRRQEKDKQLKDFHEIWTSLLFLCFFLVPVVSLIHCSYLMWVFAGVNWVVSIISIVIGTLFLYAGRVSFKTTLSNIES